MIHFTNQSFDLLLADAGVGGWLATGPGGAVRRRMLPGGVLTLRRGQDGEEQVEELFSTDPADYLRYSPGSRIS